MDNYQIIEHTTHEIEEPDYLNIQNNANIPFSPNNNFYENNSNIPYYNNRISSPEKILNIQNPKLYYSSSKSKKAKSYNHLAPINPNEEIIQNLNRKNYGTNNYRMKYSKNTSPMYLNNNKQSNNLNYNSSQIYNGLPTEEGESNINYNRDSNFGSQNPYQGVSVIYPEDQNLNDENENTYDTNEEQLIIYPDNKIINKKYFDPKTKEGLLQTKNYETYEVNLVEYSNQLFKYKPVSLGDYILKNPNKKMRKNKSCSNINLNNKDANDYEIKILNNKKNEKIKGKKIISYDKIYNIKTIKGKNKVMIKREETKSSKDSKIKEKKISKVLGQFGVNGKNIAKEKENNGQNGLLYYNKKIYNKKYNTYYKNNESTRYQKWKITASACLIQSWWRSLKILYKKYLNKIIIIQKVYKIHYKNKYLIKESKNYIKSKYNKNTKYVHKKKKVYNRPSFNKSDKEFSFSSKYSINNKYNIGILLIKKILENILMKILNNIITIIKENNKKDNNLNENETKKLDIKIEEKSKAKIYEDNLKPINIYAQNNKLYIITANKNISFSYKPNKFMKNNFNSLSPNNTNTFSIYKEKKPSKNSINNNISFSFNNPIKKAKPSKKKILLINNKLQLSFLNENKSLNNRNDLNEGKSINNFTFKNMKNNEQVYSQDINNDKNIKIISGKKNLEKSKNKNIDKNNTSDNNINATNYSKDSNSIIKEKNKDSCSIILNDKYKNLLYPIRNNLPLIQQFLLKKIFLKRWEKQANSLKNAKRAHKKDIKIYNEKNKKHILYSNLMKYVFDKIKKEVKKRKLIVCFKNINLRKYPILCYAFKKIKKYGKVRFRVMNEYASIIQNTYRYYVENKKKEEENERYQENSEQKLDDKKI